VLFGVFFGSTDLIRAGALVIAIPVIAYLVVGRSHVTIASRRTVQPARTAVGGDVEMHLTVSNRSALPVGALMLEDHLPEQLVGQVRFSLEGLAGREVRTIGYRLPTPRRGRYVGGPLTVRLTDPFGLIELTRSFSATSSFIVTPVVESVPEARTPNSLDVGENAGSHSIGTHGADDASTREYRHGDDLRKIHWRSTARTGVLMVRYEERPWQGQVALLLDLRSAGHGRGETPQSGDLRESSSVEWAISAIASVGSELLRGGRELSLLSTDSADVRIPFASTSRFVDHLADVRESAFPDLAPVADQLRLAARDSTIVAVLGALDDVSAQVLVDARPRGSAAPAFAILLDSASWSRESRASAVAARAPGNARGYRGRTIDNVAQSLRAAGWWVTEARAGESVPASWTRLFRQRELESGAHAARSVPDPVRRRLPV
jgi:uncharacterized protein (DUF58 family)